VSDPFLGEIRMFGFNFAPEGWALCNGQTLSIIQNQALFSLLGTTYGGNGTSTFALPNLQSRVPIHQGQGEGLSGYNGGEAGGAETVTLAASQMPTHTHSVHAILGPATSEKPDGRWLARAGADVYADSPDAHAVLNAGTLGDAGSGEPHNNIQPYLVVNFCIALDGTYPTRD
jgi:microcystin-dependent protein